MMGAVTPDPARGLPKAQGASEPPSMSAGALVDVTDLQSRQRLGASVLAISSR